MTIKLINHADK